MMDVEADVIINLRNSSSESGCPLAAMSVRFHSTGRLDPEWAQVDRRTLTIAGRAISSLIQTQGMGDLYRIFLSAKRDGIDYNLARIPADFKVESKEEFDREYMNALFKVGYDLAVKGYPWEKGPPGFAE